MPSGPCDPLRDPFFQPIPFFSISLAESQGPRESTSKGGRSRVPSNQLGMCAQVHYPFSSFFLSSLFLFFFFSLPRTFSPTQDGSLGKTFVFKGCGHCTTKAGKWKTGRWWKGRQRWRQEQNRRSFDKTTALGRKARKSCGSVSLRHCKCKSAGICAG